jgi:hypothetical protein
MLIYYVCYHLTAKRMAGPKAGAPGLISLRSVPELTLRSVPELTDGT